MEQKKTMRDNRGEVMLESLIVYTITIFLLFFMISLFCIMFQRWNIQTIANDAAARIAQTYPLSGMDSLDTLTGEADSDDVSEIRIYRYLRNSDELTQSATTRLRTYALQRLTKTTFTKNVADPVVEVEVVHDALASRHIEVTITGSYTVPFGAALTYFGFNSTITYDVTAYAECVDLKDYIDMVDYVDYQTSLSQFDSKLIKMINAFFSLADNIRDLFSGLSSNE